MKTIARIIYWRYSRGSWQYDILCALILGFIFLTPHEIFDGSYFTSRQPPEIEEKKQPADHAFDDEDQQDTHLVREPVCPLRRSR